MVRGFRLPLPTLVTSSARLYLLFRAFVALALDKMDRIGPGAGRRGRLLALLRLSPANRSSVPVLANASR